MNDQAVLTGGEVGSVTFEPHAFRIARHIYPGHPNRILWIFDIKNLQAVFTVCHIGIAVFDRHITG